MKYIVTIEGVSYEIEIGPHKRVTLNGQPIQVDLQTVDGQQWSLLTNNKSFEALVEQNGALTQVLMGGNLYSAHVADERQQLLDTVVGFAPEEGPIAIKAPMPGVIIDVPVQPGQAVGDGDVVIILESMKMENELRAPRAGTVLTVKVSPGESVEQRQVMIVLE